VHEEREITPGRNQDMSGAPRMHARPSEDLGHGQGVIWKGQVDDSGKGSQIYRGNGTKAQQR